MKGVVVEVSEVCVYVVMSSEFESGKRAIVRIRVFFCQVGQNIDTLSVEVHKKCIPVLLLYFCNSQPCTKETKSILPFYSSNGF